MANTFDGPFGGYTNVADVVSAAAQTTILAECDKLKALIPAQSATSSASASTPDFDQIPPHTAAKLRTEIDALKAAIDAAPTS